ncbi:hypothetical protein [Demequina sp. NBRC 110054]|uniref:hypothetical protein n=1 Tax=Demequina sp. NBRC 110054 TaxID=1570343 RepID=UPI00190EC19D|nr:hypothetical protein [Demequina sp. NBRC 110054]
MEKLTAFAWHVESGIWHVEMPSIDVATQALTEADIAHMAADAAASLTGTPASDFDVVVWKRGDGPRNDDRQDPTSEADLLRQFEQSQANATEDAAASRTRTWEDVRAESLAAMTPAERAEYDATYEAFTNTDDTATPGDSDLVRQFEEAQRLDRESGEREVWDAVAGDMLAREPWAEGLTAEEAAAYVAEADPGWMSPEVISDYLKSGGSYDELTEAQQAQARELWSAQMTERIASLDLAADFEAAGRQYSELDEDGNVVIRNAQPAETAGDVDDGTDDPLDTMERVRQILRPLAREGVVLWWMDTPTDVLDGMTPHDWIEAGRDADRAIDYANKTAFVWSVGEKE